MLVFTPIESFFASLNRLCVSSFGLFSSSTPNLYQVPALSKKPDFLLVFAMLWFESTDFITEFCLSPLLDFNYSFYQGPLFYNFYFLFG
jgi:hypothetical protein